MKVLETKWMQGYMRLANDGWNMGWHERNGGNLSYRISEEEINQVKECLIYDLPWMEIGVEVDLLAGEKFLVTGSGKFFRNVQTYPEESTGIIEISKDGKCYRILWGLLHGAKPTSELPTHLLNHQIQKERTAGAHRVIYHCHTPNMIALTFVLPLEDKVFTKELWSAATECPVVFPDGVGVVSWMIPGGKDIAQATALKMRKYDAAIWAHHGTFASGIDFDITFGLMHTLEKAAEILVKVYSMGGKKNQGMSDEELVSLGEAFKVQLPEEFLDKLEQGERYDC